MNYWHAMASHYHAIPKNIYKNRRTTIPTSSPRQLTNHCAGQADDDAKSRKGLKVVVLLLLYGEPQLVFYAPLYGPAQCLKP